MRGGFFIAKGAFSVGAAKTFEQVRKANTDEPRFLIVKSDDDKRLVFGWANVATRVSGEVITDFQDDIIEIDVLEKAAYEYTLDFGVAGEVHERGGVGRLVESVVFTKEKAAAMGIPEGYLPEGWWVGYYIEDDDVWKKIKTGEYSMFSIEGTATRVPVGD